MNYFVNHLRHLEQTLHALLHEESDPFGQVWITHTMHYWSWTNLEAWSRVGDGEDCKYCMPFWSIFSCVITPYAPPYFTLFIYTRHPTLPHTSDTKVNYIQQQLNLCTVTEWCSSRCIKKVGKNDFSCFWKLRMAALGEKQVHQRNPLMQDTTQCATGYLPT